MTIRLFEVGGSVRDDLLGISHTKKDIDFSVEAGSYEEMKAWVEEHSTKIFLESPEFLTIRAQFPGGLDQDFVLCRKDGCYHDGRHPEDVEMGTLEDDLARRDFTINALAREWTCEDGQWICTGDIIDRHGGLQDLKDRKIRCVGSTIDRMDEDALRMLRAIRFCITKRLLIDDEIRDYIRKYSHQISAVSESRIREELTKCCKASTMETLGMFHWFPHLAPAIFERTNIWLLPTVKGR